MADQNKPGVTPRAGSDKIPSLLERLIGRRVPHRGEQIDTAVERAVTGNQNLQPEDLDSDIAKREKELADLRAQRQSMFQTIKNAISR